MPDIQRWKYDRKLTATMVEDMIHNPILAAKVLLGLKIPPHEELRIMWMWTTYYTNDDSGFSTGKSFTHAIVSALRSILFPGRVSGILSKTYAQGKLIFANYDRWYSNSSIFRYCVKHQGGKSRLVHGSDAHVAYFRGGSECRVLPPNFLQDAERLRSERWHDGYFDEWTTYGRFEAFNKTIIGRVTKENVHPDCPIRQNHIHLSSTPSFKNHPSFDMIRNLDRTISAGSDDHGRFTCNYRHIPDTKKWRWLVNRKVIFTMETTLPRGIVNTEVNGIWEDDSHSYYSAVAIEKRRFYRPMSFTKDDGYIYVGGYDVARGGSSTANASKADDFSISVLKFKPEEDSPPIHVYTERKNNIKSGSMAGIIHKVVSLFNIRMLAFDPGGGGLFVKDELEKPVALIDNENVSVNPIIEFNSMTGIIGNEILVPILRSNFLISQVWGKMQSDSVLVNRIHQEMKNSIEAEKVSIMLSTEWDGWDRISPSSEWDINAKRDYLNKSVGLSKIDKIRAEMDLAVSQLIFVDVARDKANGMPILDSYGMYRFKSSGKKDSAYGLIYAKLAHLLYTKFFSTPKSSDDKSSKYSVSISAV